MLEDIQAGVATLSVPTRFLRSWIQSHYMDHLTALLAQQVRGLQRVLITVRSTENRPSAATGRSSGASEGAAASQPQARAASHATSSAVAGMGGISAHGFPSEGALTSSSLDRRCTFDNFFLGASNALAHAAAVQCAEACPARPAPFNPLYVHSGVGLGKTHLVQALAQRAEAAGKRVVYLTAERFMFGFVSALKTQSTLAFKESLRSIDLLIVDDVQFLTGKSVQHEFGHTLTALLESCRQVVVTADRRPGDLEALDERVRSRLAGGLVVEMGALDDELRRRIVTARVEAAQTRHASFHVTDAVINYIAAAINTNGRDLDGAVNRLLAHAMLTQGPVTLPVAEEAIRDLVAQSESRRVKIEDIQRIVAQHYNVSRADLLSARRTATVVRPRQVAIYLAKIMTLRSLPEIGRRFGGRDHTTVLHAVRKIEGLIHKDAQLAQEVERLKQVLQTN